MVSTAVFLIGTEQEWNVIGINAGSWEQDCNVAGAVTRSMEQNRDVARSVARTGIVAGAVTGSNSSNSSSSSSSNIGFGEHDRDVAEATRSA